MAVGATLTRRTTTAVTCCLCSQNSSITHGYAHLKEGLLFQGVRVRAVGALTHDWGRMSVLHRSYSLHYLNTG